MILMCTIFREECNIEKENCKLHNKSKATCQSGKYTLKRKKNRYVTVSLKKVESKWQWNIIQCYTIDIFRSLFMEEPSNQGHLHWMYMTPASCQQSMMWWSSPCSTGGKNIVLNLQQSLTQETCNMQMSAFDWQLLDECLHSN